MQCSVAAAAAGAKGDDAAARRFMLRRFPEAPPIDPAGIEAFDRAIASGRR